MRSRRTGSPGGQRHSHRPAAGQPRPHRLPALLNQDTEGLVVLLPDGLSEPGRELMAALASLAVLSARVAARAEGIAEGEHLDRIIQPWTDSPR